LFSITDDSTEKSINVSIFDAKGLRSESRFQDILLRISNAMEMQIVFGGPNQPAESATSQSIAPASNVNSPGSMLSRILEQIDGLEGAGSQSMGPGDTPIDRFNKLLQHIEEMDARSLYVSSLLPCLDIG
jgi:hypothetical protein